MVMAVKFKSGDAVMAKVSSKTAKLLGRVIIKALAPYEGKVKTLTDYNAEEFCEHALIDQAFKSAGYFTRSFSTLEGGAN